MAPQKFHSLAETLLSTARSGFELYTKWYQSQQQARRKRKRILNQDKVATTSFVSSSATSNDPPAVCLDASSTESSSSGDAQQSNKRQRIQHHDKKDPCIPRFKLGTCVRKVGTRNFEANVYALHNNSPSSRSFLFSTFQLKGGLMEKSSRDSGMMLSTNGFTTLILNRGKNRGLSRRMY
jgi:hypothetical protein